MPQFSQSSFQNRPIQRFETRAAGAPAAVLAWPVSAAILLAVSGAFWFAVVEAAVRIF